MTGYNNSMSNNFDDKDDLEIFRDFDQDFDAWIMINEDPGRDFYEIAEDNINTEINDDLQSSMSVLYNKVIDGYTAALAITRIQDPVITPTRIFNSTPLEEDSFPLFQKSDTFYKANVSHHPDGNRFPKNTSSLFEKIDVEEAYKNITSVNYRFPYAIGNYAWRLRKGFESYVNHCLSFPLPLNFDKDLIVEVSTFDPFSGKNYNLPFFSNGGAVYYIGTIVLPFLDILKYSETFDITTATSSTYLKVLLLEHLADLAEKFEIELEKAVNACLSKNSNDGTDELYTEFAMFLNWLRYSCFHTQKKEDTSNELPYYGNAYMTDRYLSSYYNIERFFNDFLRFKDEQSLLDRFHRCL